MIFHELDSRKNDLSYPLPCVVSHDKRSKARHPVSAFSAPPGYLPEKHSHTRDDCGAGEHSFTELLHDAGSSFAFEDRA